MYIPDSFREGRAEILQAFVAKHPLAALITASAEGITANHIPLIWHARDGAHGVLQGHLARANPLWKNLDPRSPVLAIFSGANRYISPSWYPARKEHGKVVPTWNYSVVHVHGTMRFVEDRDLSLRHVSELADRQEAGRADPWKVSEASQDFIDSMLDRIVPFEITVSRMIGKFKANQQRPVAERSAVLTAMAAEDVPLAEREELIRLTNPS